MNGPKRVGRRTWGRVALTLIFGSAAAFALVACSDLVNESSVSPGEQSSPAKEADAVDMAFTQYRDCDRSTSIYTVDVDRALAMGEAGSRQGAITNTIENAIKEEVAKQFECNDCPDEFMPEPCADYFGTIAMGSASLEDPDKDCELIDGRWYCFSWVTFGHDGRDKSWAQAGCDLCDEDEKEVKELQTLRAERF